MNTNIVNRPKKVIIYLYVAFVTLCLEYRKFWLYIRKKNFTQ